MGLANGDKFNFSFLSGFANGSKTSWTSIAGNNDALTFVQGTLANGNFTAGVATQDKGTLIVYDTVAGSGENYEGIVVLDSNFSGILNGSTVTLTAATPPPPRPQ